MFLRCGVWVWSRLLRAEYKYMKKQKKNEKPKVAYACACACVCACACADAQSTRWWASLSLTGLCVVPRTVPCLSATVQFWRKIKSLFDEMWKLYKDFR